MLPSKRYYLDSMFDDFFYNNNMKCDIYHDSNNYYIEANVSGISKDNINVTLENGYININVTLDNYEERDYIKRERFYGNSSRSFYVGDVEINKISASLENGMLKVVIPKSSKVSNRINIDIK